MQGPVDIASRLQAKLKSEYAKKDSLPKLLEDEDFPAQRIEDTYVNLMLIESEKDKSDSTRIEKRAYGSYEDISAKKIEIDIENVFDSKVQPDKPAKAVNKILIYGRAGIGKTTLCNYISYKWSHGKLWADKFDYVFWLPLRSLSGDWYTLYQNDISEYALECFIKHYCLVGGKGFEVKELAEVIENSKVLLILDGYDEIASFHNEKHTVVKRVIDSAIEVTNKQAKVIMTSRPNAVSHGVIDKFDAEIENIGLKKEDVCKYISQYVFKEKEKTEGLLSLIKQHGHIESIAQVPINLYLLCLTWDIGSFKGKAGITATELYEEVTSWLMKRYISKFKEKELDGINYDGIAKVCEEEYKLLEKLAYCGVKKKTAILRKEECNGSGVDWSKLGTLKKLGILSGKGVEKSVQEYEFIHLTFQEYFAAHHIVKVLNGGTKEEIKEVVTFLNENKYNRVYERVILFIAGLVTLEFSKQSGKQAMKYFWNVMLNGRIDLRAIKQLGLLIRCLEEGKCSEGIPGIEKVLDVIKQYSLKHFDQLEQSLNMSTQVSHKSGVVEGLAGKLKSPYKWVCRDATKALGKLKLDNVEVAKAVVDALFKDLEDPDEFVHSAAADALGELKLDNAEVAKAVVGTLCKALASPDQLMRRAAAYTLKQLKLSDVGVAKTVVEALCKALEDPDHCVRSAAANASGELKLSDVALEKTLVYTLYKALEDYGKSVRMNAAKALWKLKPNDVELAKAVANALLKMLEDSTPVAEVLWGLELDDVGLAKVVANALLKEFEGSDKHRRRDAVRALGQLKLNNVELTKAVVATLCKALKNPDKDTRSAAVEVLKRLKPGNAQLAKVVVEALCNAFEDKDRYVRWAAVRALNELKTDNMEVEKAVVEALCKALKDDRGVRMTAAYALMRLKPGNFDVEKVMVETLHEELEDRRIDAARVLGQLKLNNVELTKAVVATLCKALKDPDKYMRIAAINALGQLKLDDMELAKSAVNALCKALDEDPDQCVRIAAACVLGQLKPDDMEIVQAVVKILCASLLDPDKYVREDAVCAFGKFKVKSESLQEEVAKPLLTEYKDQNGVIYENAIKALIRLKVTSIKVQRQIAEALIENITLMHRMGYYLLGRLNYNDGQALNRALEKCAISGIRLPFKKHSMKLLELFEKSAITLNNSCLALYYGDHKLVFELDNKDKELPMKIWEHFKKRAKCEGQTEMLDSLVKRDNWIEIEGIEPEIDRIISNKLINTRIDMKTIIKEELELALVTDTEVINSCIGDLLQVCVGFQQQSWLVGKYKEQKQSPILAVALQFAMPGIDSLEGKIKPEHIKTVRGVIAELSSRGIGMKFKDKHGNTIGHFAIKYWYVGLDKLLLQDSLYKTANNKGATIAHTAVFYGCIEGICNSIGKGNLNFTQKVQVGEWKLTPLELAIALGDVEVIKKISNITQDIPRTDLCGGNVLSLALEFGRYDVLHHLLYGHKMDWKLVQEAFVFASVVGNKGNIEALRTIKGSFRRYNACSIAGYNSIGNTALHEVVGKEGMKRRDKLPIINYLVAHDKDLLNTFNDKMDKKHPREMATSPKLKDYLEGIQVQIAGKKYKVPDIWETPIKNIVFKGGGPRGVVYVGALKGFEKIQRERGFEDVERVAGTSAGAITAGLYAIGYTAEELENDLATISLISLLDSENIKSLIAGERNNKGISGKIGYLLSKQGIGGDKLIFELINTLGDKGGLCSGSNFEKILEGLIYKKTNKGNFTLGDLRKKVQKGTVGYKELSVVTLNINDNKQTLVVLSTDNPLHSNIRLLDAIRASMSIPIVYEPKKIEYYEEDGKKVELRCIDGGMIYNYPVDIFDKVRYQHTGQDAIQSEKPEYNPYTLGLSISSKRQNNINNNVNNKAVESNAITDKLKDACGGLIKWLIGCNPIEVVKDMKSMVEQVKPIIAVLKEGESVRNEYWKLSDEKRTIKIDCSGVGLMDFDLSEEKIKEMIEGGEKAVQGAFDEDLQRAKIDSNVSASIGNISQKSSSQRNPNASTSLSTQNSPGQGVKIEGVTKVNPTQQQRREEDGCVLI